MRPAPTLHDRRLHLREDVRPPENPVVDERPTSFGVDYDGARRHQVCGMQDKRILGDVLTLLKRHQVAVRGVEIGGQRDLPLPPIADLVALLDGAVPQCFGKPGEGCSRREGHLGLSACRR